MPRKTTLATAARMRAMLLINRDRYWWSAKEWAEFLDCFASTIVATKTWQSEIREYRLKAHAVDPRSKRVRVADHGLSKGGSD